MDNIERLLKERDLTKTALSDLLGVKKQNLNSLMRNPTLETIKKFASVLGVQPYELFAPAIEHNSNNELVALVHYKGLYFKASTIDELADIVDEIRASTGQEE